MALGLFEKRSSERLDRRMAGSSAVKTFRKYQELSAIGKIK